MTPEDKIVAAIEEAKREIVRSIAWEIFRASLFLACVMAIVTILASVAKSAPLLPPLLEPTPLQYWHTTHIPQDGGVYPLEVFAPALPPLVVQPQIVEIGEPPAPPTGVPEPGTWISLLIGIVVGILYTFWSRTAKVKRRRLLLEAIRKLEPNASTLAIGQEVEGKVRFGRIYTELSAMHEEGILTRHSTIGGPERGGRSRVFYSIARKALE